MNALRASYLALAILAVASIVAFIVLPLGQEGWRSFTLNLGTEVVGILLTVLLIDRVIRRRDKQERERYRSVALQQLRLPLNNHLLLLFNIYKASVEEKPDREISRVEDLFGDDYVEQTAHLDLTSSGPIYPPMQWFQYLHMEMQQFKDELGHVVDKYAVHLDPETIDLAEQLSNSTLLTVITRGVPLANWVTNGQVQRPFGLLVGPSSAVPEMIREHTDPFSRLVEIYNREALHNRKILVQDHMWRNDVCPLIGSARVSLPSAATDDNSDEAGTHST